MDDLAESEYSQSTKFQQICYLVGINPHLISLKLCLFFLYGATASLMPYLVVHMQSIGLTVKEIAMVYLALPFTTFLAPPLTGFLIDKFGKYKSIVITSMLLNAFIHHLLLLIPYQELPGVMPAAYVIRHNVTENVEVWWSPCPSRECPEEEELDMVLDRCIDYCLLNDSAEVPKEIEFEQNDEDDLIFHLGKKAVKSATFFMIDMHPNLADPSEQLGIEMQPDENETFTEFTDRFTVDYLTSRQINVTDLENLDLRCGGVVLATNITYKTRLQQLAENCILQKCAFRSGGPEICPPDYKESDDIIFWLYFGLRFLGQIALSASVTIMDPIALTLIQKYNGNFGKERLFSSIGMAIFAPLIGIFIDIYSKNLGYTNYTPAFYSYDILLLISALAVFLMPIEDKLPADNILKDLLKILTMPHIVIFILFLFLLGNFWGFIESFLFLYLKELGAPNYMLGITVTVGTLSSLPFLYGADRIIRKFGHVSVFVIAFFSHAARLMGYSFIESPWWCFPFEALESLSVHLFWVAAATYCAILAPKNLLASLIGVVGMSHFSIGRGSGSFLGGILIENFGTRESFRLMGLLAIFGGIFYGVIHIVWLREIETNNAEIIDDDEDLDEENGDKKHSFSEGEIEGNSRMSAERLSLVIEYNQIGSLSSLRRSFNENFPRRRSSYNVDSFKNSSNKVDLLKMVLNPQGSSNSSLKRIKSLHQKINNDEFPDEEKKASSSISELKHKNSISEAIVESDDDKSDS